MNLIRTLIDGPAPAGRAEGRVPTQDHTSRGLPPKVAPMSRADELGLLEKKALEKGISRDELDETRRIGDCPAQVATRIRHLHEWLDAH